MYKLAVIGSRSFNDWSLLNSTLLPYKSKIEVIISGGAKGADTLAEEWAIANNIEVLKYIPDWDIHGKKAGFIRNEDIIKNCNACIAFWDGKSRGTNHSLDLCSKYNKPWKVIYF